jgi:hypothetical protein
VENKAFWKIVLSLRRNHLKPNQKITLWAESLGHNDIHRIPLNEAKNELRKAQKKLKEIKQRAFELREEHLRELLSINTEFGDDNEHKKRLQILIRAHTQKKSFQRIQQVLRPSERTGLSYIVVPEKFQPSNFPYNPGKVTNWEMIHNQERLKECLLQRNMTHFGQAHGTPFTTQPLNKLDWNSTSLEAESILDGVFPTEFESTNPFAKEILRHIANRKQLPAIDTYLSPEEVANGFKRWKESTSTSPSGCHLGL